MKKALIQPDGRIVQVVDAAAVFPVAAPLRWVDVPTDTAPEDRLAAGTVQKRQPDPEPTPLQKIVGLEVKNPITHRGQREFYIGFGEAFPEFQKTLLYQRAKAVDDAIVVERAKL